MTVVGALVAAAGEAQGSGEFLVTPGLGLIVWTVLVVLVVPAGVATALKGRWGWLVAGLVLGFPLLVSAFLPAAPDSLWARRRGRASASLG